MLPVAEEMKKILIVEPAVADSITGEKWNRYVFRTGRSSYQDALANAAAVPDGDVSIGMVALDTAFGRDGVAAFKTALAGVRPKAKVVAEEYAAGNTADFTPFAERLFNAMKDKPGRKIIAFIWAGAHPIAKFVDMKPERFGIELAPGGNLLPVMAAWKAFAGAEGGIYYYYDFPKNAQNDWLKAEYRKRFNAPPDFFVAGGFAAASAVVTALQKAGSTDTEKLIAAMEGMSFETPKGTMTFRKEDHQALQDMYHWRIKKDAKDNDMLELVATIAAKDMPLPIRTKK
jgi:branched-chain amino acid transport system substrate-binding protein